MDKCLLNKYMYAYFSVCDFRIVYIHTYINHKNPNPFNQTPPNQFEAVYAS